ncbi:penicillin-binding transpeptidase domain-containing protein [Kitasatospora sp. Root107]|uniref:penicillin-binding transpeptidase domain-containing protein n=1 Tax=Kitasatospora sp. Root107 TaxID=1736424 RepID=UPI00070F681F|nr:penicillin-binding transpeptidase domain-containing protein [Kitasatospora sp. Root107]KQV16635.1 hypothetical protein ASC99_28095 [Kitasatospora sp. Root107]
MHNGAKIGVAAVTAAMFAGGGYAAYSLVAGDDAGSSAPKAAQSPKVLAVVAELPSAEVAAQGASAFLAAWAKGDYEEAGRHTDKPAAAIVALAKFRDTLTPTSLALTPGGPTAANLANSSASPSASGVPTGAGVPLSFHAKVELKGAASAWQYDGAVAMVKLNDGRAVVHWEPSVVHPKLDGTKVLAVQPISASASQVVDRKGRPLTEFPSVQAVLEQIRFKDEGTTASGGTGVVVTQAGGSGTPERLFTITEPKDGAKKPLTLDADLQRVAEAVAKGQSGPASVVAIEPSTGQILALANNPAQGPNRAFGATIAPGSTMKVITAAALLEAGLTPDSPLPCPKTTNVSGRAVPNDFLDERLGNTFKDDFAQSCNTAFLEAGQAKLKPGTLPALSKDVFGLGLVWQTGLPTFDTKVPLESNPAETAMAYIGQGRIQTNSLAMASVAATVQSGTFRQPILVPGTAQPRAARSLDRTVLGQLQSMMRRTVQSGTASGALGGIPGAAAKTGTAEVNGQSAPNSWITAYAGNLAVAVEVQAGGHGATAAGPAAAKLLEVGNKG